MVSERARNHGMTRVGLYIYIHCISKKIPTYLSPTSSPSSSLNEQIDNTQLTQEQKLNENDE